MKKILPIVLLFGGLIVFSGVLDKAFTATSANSIADNKPRPEIINQIKPVASSLSNPRANVILADLNQIEPVKIIEPQLKPVRKLLLEDVNGITLTDDMKTVIKKIGQPLSKVKDPFLSEMEVYAYPQMNIAFSDGIVSYVEIMVAAGTANIDGIPIEISEKGLKNTLGEPNFVAADGLVFQRNHSYIKLFTDMDTHEVTVLHYYHHANI